MGLGVSYERGTPEQDDGTRVHSHVYLLNPRSLASF